MRKLLIIGGGNVGSAMAMDLAPKHDVTVFDVAERKYPANINFKRLNLLQEHNPELLLEFDLVITAVPGHTGFEILKKVIEAGKNVVDISFFPEDPFELDTLARNNNITAIVDCGLAPGLGNLVLGYHHARMQLSSFRCYVAGLPVERTWPFAYKAVFSPVDVIEEYTRPARLVQNGEIVIKEALSELEMIEVPGIGTLEAFNTDGLRTLLSTIQIPELLEKTMRYPGSTQYLQMLKQTGFFSSEALQLNGISLKPLDFTSQILFKQWQVRPGDEDLSVLVIKLAGEENGKQVYYEYFMTDQYDRQNKCLSMARTTGYTCTAAANLLLDGVFEHKGICPPEFIGADEAAFYYMMDYLRQRNIKFKIEKSDEI